MRPRRQLHDGDDHVGDVFGKEHFGFALLADGGGTVFQNGRVHFAWVDVGDADAVGDFFAPRRDAEGGDGEFAGVVGDAAERPGPFAGGGGDVDDDAVFFGPHLW